MERRSTTSGVVTIICHAVLTLYDRRCRVNVCSVFFFPRWNVNVFRLPNTLKYQVLTFVIVFD